MTNNNFVRLTSVLLGLFLITVSAASANDGFYQGSGSTLIPVNNSKMRVITEKLEITPIEKPKCYPVIIPQSGRDKSGNVLDSAEAHLGAVSPCKRIKKEMDIDNQLIAKWHARAEYHVEALENQSSVQIGFPVPSWESAQQNSEGRVDLEVPGVANFKTYQDNVEIKDIKVAQIADPNSKGKTPAFVWQSNFEKGKNYDLVTEYDFGVNYSGDFYQEREIPKNAILWFDTRSQAEARFEIATFSNESLEYFLTPIRLWTGGVPDSIEVKVQTPKSISSFYFLPMTHGLECVDSHALYFRWNKSFPSENLKLTYPETSAENSFAFNPFARMKNYPTIKKQYELDAWADYLARFTNDKPKPGYFPHIKKTCALRSEIEKSLPKDAAFHNWLKMGIEPCVQSCEAN